MNIEVTLLNEVIDELVETIQKKLNGDMHPAFSKSEAILELGVIYDLVLNLLEKLDDERVIEDVLVIREKIITTNLEIMGFLITAQFNQ